MSEERVWPPPEWNLVDLGHGIYWTKAVHGEGEDEQWIGILEWHQCKDEPGHLSAGGVYFDNAPDWCKGTRWTLEKADPLTISPSILCHTCGLHGFIREGQWVPA